MVILTFPGADRGAYSNIRITTKARHSVRTESEFFAAEHLIVMDAAGTLDLSASKAALKKLTEDPEFDAKSEILMDLRDIDCVMTIADIFELANAMAWPNPTLPTFKKVAVLVSGSVEFDHAKFLALCASNRGLRIAAFDDYDKAGDWLVATLPADPKEECAVEFAITPALATRTLFAR